MRGNLFAVAVDLVVLTVRDGRLCDVCSSVGASRRSPGSSRCRAGSSCRTRTCSTPPPASSSRRRGWSWPGGHLEQLASYAAPDRDPRGRVLSVGHLALVPRPARAARRARTPPAAPGTRSRTVGRRCAFDHDRILADGVERARAEAGVHDPRGGVLPAGVHRAAAARDLRGGLGRRDRPAQLPAQGHHAPPASCCRRRSRSAAAAAARRSCSGAARRRRCTRRCCAARTDVTRASGAPHTGRNLCDGDRLRCVTSEARVVPDQLHPRARSRRRVAPEPRRTSPSTHAGTCRAVSTASARSTSSAGSTATIPTPMLNVFSISARSTRPREAISLNTGAGVQVLRSTTASSPVRQHPLEVAGQPAAGDVRERAHAGLGGQRQAVPGVDAGGDEQLLAEGVPELLDVAVERHAGRCRAARGGPASSRWSAGRTSPSPPARRRGGPARAAASARPRRCRRRWRRGRSRRPPSGRGARRSRRRAARSPACWQPSAMPATMAAICSGTTLPTAM